MKQIIDIYTATYADHREKEYQGTAFAALIKGKKGTVVYANSYKTLTYIDVWMKEMAMLLARITINPTEFDDAVIHIHSWTPNVNRMSKKLLSVYDELKQYDDEKIWKNASVMLRRKNRTFYPYHNDLMKIINTLLVLNKRIPLTLVCKATSPHRTIEMKTVYQSAIVELENPSTNE